MSELLQLDLFRSRENRDAGIQQAIDHANQVHENWQERAYIQLVDYLKLNKGEFMAEELREWAEGKGFPEPPHARAWGAIIMRAARANLIRKVRIGNVKNVKAHNAHAAVWQSA